MSLFKKFLYRKPPDGLLEISERVYVFDCCFTTDVLEDEEYKDYMGGKAGQLRQHFLDASFMVFNFRKGEKQSQISNILSDYDMIVMDYPCQYEGCPLLTMEMIHHCLRSGESWLSLGQQSILLMHCERGGWPILAFTLAALLIYRKQFTGEHKTLEMVYKQAPRELLQLMSPLNPLPSQLRYLQYISRRNVASEWPPRDRSLILDCIILRVIPNLVGDGGIRPIFRIYGPDPFAAFNRTPKVLFSTPKKSKFVRHHKQADCELVKIDINCSVQGDVVLECINLDSEQERESMMFRVMFNTAFIRSNILMLNREEIEILWDTKDQFPKDFRAEVLFSEMDSATSRVSIDLLSDEEKDGLPIEAFTKIQEIFNQADWIGPKAEGAINVLQQIKASDVLQEDMNAATPRTAPLLESTIKKVKGRLEALNDNTRSPASSTFSTLKPSIDPNSIQKKFESHEPHDEKLTSATSISQEEQSLKSSIEPVSIQKKIESHELQEEQSIPSLKPSVDLNSVQKKIESHDMRVATQRPAQAKIISPQIAQASMPSPTSTAQAKITLSPTSSSSPTSHSPVSRYQDMSSALGITALLHDHAASKGEESPSAISSPTITNLPKSMHLPTLPSPTSPPLPPGHALPSSTEKSRSAPPPPPPPPLPVSKATDYSLSQSSGPIETRVQSSLVPPMPPSLPSYLGVTSTPTTTSSHSTPLSPPLPPLFPIKNSCSVPSPPPPPSPTSFSRESPSSAVNNSFSPSPPPLPAAGAASSAASRKEATSKPPPPPPPPLLRSASATSSTPAMSSAPQPPPPPPGPAPKGPLSNNPPVPPPPAAPPPAGPLVNGKADSAFPQSNSGISNVPCINAPPVPGPPSVSFGSKARGLSRPTAKTQAQTRKANLKPYHWLKLTRAVQGSLWAETQKTDDSSKAPEFDMSELESLFSVAAPNTNKGNADGKSNRRGPKTEKIQLIELRRAYNCEIMLTKVKVPLPDLMSSLLALDSSALDVDQVDNLIKFCPTKEEMESLKGYKGDKENLGKCEQFFLELMKVPRVESKLRVFSFKIQFCTQISDLRKNLNTVNSAAEEVRNSAKLKKIMQTILSLGNALNHGTARGSAIGFRLDSLLKLTETRARNNKMTLMHYLCKILAEKLPELLDFYKDLQSLEAATKIQLKFLAEEMQAVSRGLEKVIQEFAASENDGLVSANFCANLKEFLGFAEGEVRSLASLYSSVGRSADALALYFGEDPARVPFEQATLLNFVRMFVRAHDENCKQIELEEKKAQKEAANEKSKSAPKKESQEFSDSPVKRNNIK